MSAKTETISFRLSTQLVRLVDRECELLGIARGALVRHVLTQHLQQDELTNAQFADLRHSLSGVNAELATIRIGVARMAFALLKTAGNLAPADARQVVRELFEDPGFAESVSAPPAQEGPP